MNLFRTQIEDKTQEIRDEQFQVTEARVVPSIESKDLTFSNSGKAFYATIVYIDIRHSSELLDKHRYVNVAKLLTAYYNAIVRVASKEKGEIRSFNGDSLLVFFMGTDESVIAKAFCSAMEMSHTIINIVNPLMRNLSNLDFGIGIDYGKVLAVKVGKRGDNANKDLVWIGNGVNRATKISDKCRAPYHIGLSEKVYNYLNLSQLYKDKAIRFFRIPRWTESSLIYNGKEEKMYKTSLYKEI